ncbi:hypothetical protein RSOLAG22IIIB_04146 [Rhizoctonia solani]|uniref:F-box domain-containing protein n=1 Tax=Rhizoctonia solani TaxID=456999 RepID=A0A0K6FUE6_9AGAM|nr:hypothetical protein RSOLAG22IIIB_04146 [Rhizoctonia solani]
MESFRMQLAMRKDPSQDNVNRNQPLRKSKRARLAKGRRRGTRISPKNRLDRFIGIPIEIFSEITSHLVPKDIISLSRASKFLRELLMRRSSRHIWTSSMKNIEGLPACPPDMSEPHYLALLFARDCTGCGRPIGARLYEDLRVRYCTSCRNSQLVVINVHGMEAEVLIPQSVLILSTQSIFPRPIFYAIKEEAENIQNKLRELQNAGDDQALDAWVNEKLEVVRTRRAEAVMIKTFLNRWRRDSKAGLRH